MSDPTSRVLQLLSLLQTHRFWPGTELADRLRVSPRTLRRDVDRLRELGYLVDATPGVAGGYRLAAGNHLPPLLLDDEEAVAIAVGLRSAADASVQGIDQTAVRALAKLEQVLPDRLRRQVHAVHANVVPLRWSARGPLVDPDALALLSLACRDHEQVQFDYARRDGEESRRLVEPHQLVSAGRRWYLVAWDLRREDWRTFRLDRLSEVRHAGPRFRPRELPAEDAAAFVEASMGAMPTRFQAQVIVDAPNDVVAETTRYLASESEVLADGRCRVRIGADSLEWMAVTIANLALDGAIELDGPEELRSMVAVVGARLVALGG